MWDLRGNPIGFLTSAVEVLDRFLVLGVRGRTEDQNWIYWARRADPLNLSLVLLIGGVVHL